MNLGKAKLILIIAFTGLNLFLGYYLYWPDFGRLTQVALTEEDLNSLETFLAENNYLLNATLDRSVQTANFLTVSTDFQLQRRIILDLFQKGAQFNQTDDATYYRVDNQTVIIQSTGLIKVIYSPPAGFDHVTLNDESLELHGKIEKFIDEEGFLPGAVSFDFSEETSDDEQIFHYYQIVNGSPLFAGRLKAFVEKNRLKMVEIYWLELQNSGPVREMEVITSAQALMNLIRVLGPSSEERYINSVTLGHFSGDFAAEKWEIPPVWRIVIDNNEIYYINAFTGNLEQEGIIPEQVQQ